MAKTSITKTILTLFFTAALLLISPAMSDNYFGVDAQEATESSEPSVTNVQEKEQEATKKLKERIEKIVEEKKEQIQETVQEISKQKKGFIGEVVRVSESAITVKNSKGNKIIPVDESISITKKGKAFEVEDIAVGDWLSVLGWIDDDAFVTRKVFVSSTTLRPKEHIVLLGTISEIDKTQISFKPRSSEETMTLVTDTKTSYEDFEGETAKKLDFEEDMQALVVGYRDDDEVKIMTLRALGPFFKEEN